MVGSRRLCRDADPSTGTNSVLVTRLGGEADGYTGLRSFGWVSSCASGSIALLGVYRELSFSPSGRSSPGG